VEELTFTNSGSILFSNPSAISYETVLLGESFGGSAGGYSRYISTGGNGEPAGSFGSVGISLDTDSAVYTSGDQAYGVIASSRGGHGQQRGRHLVDGQQWLPRR